MSLDSSVSPSSGPRQSQSVSSSRKRKSPDTLLFGKHGGCRNRFGFPASTAAFRFMSHIVPLFLRTMLMDQLLDDNTDQTEPETRVSS